MGYQPHLRNITKLHPNGRSPQRVVKVSCGASCVSEGRKGSARSADRGGKKARGKLCEGVIVAVAKVLVHVNDCLAYISDL
jgi:hypothetical protein